MDNLPPDAWLTVRKLITHLQTLPLDARVIYSCCSDWVPMKAKDVELARGVLKSFYVMRVPEQQYKLTAKDLENIDEFVAFPGN